MRSVGLALRSVLFLAVLAAAARAQAQRTFVSAGGSDTNPCSRPAPCRTFAQAISQTNAGGEVIVLDSAGYGPFMIAKSISIIAAPGVYAGISVFSGDGVGINAGVTDSIVLRGLTVNNQGSPGSGIVFNAGAVLHVESCVINGFSSGLGGLAFIGSGELDVKDSIMRGNSNGILIQPPSQGVARAAIDQVRLEANGLGLEVLQGSIVTARDTLASANGTGFSAASSTSDFARLNLQKCVASNNLFDGISAISSSSGLAEVNLERCVATANNIGIAAASPSGGVATVRVSNSLVTHNNTGLSNTGPPAFILSRVNNTVEANTTNTSGPILSYTAK